jgi:tetratricopeptide (TPR) repeat protein
MTASHIFISHATADDSVVADLRRTLEGLNLEVWTDSQRLSGGDPLKPAVRDAIEKARHFLAVLSPRAINSAWVREEIQHALKVQKKRGDGFKVIPLLLDGIEPSALPLWFGAEPLAVKIHIGPGGVSQALPELLAALGERLPTDPASPVKKDAPPLAELVLELAFPALDRSGGKHRATAIATLIYCPPDKAPEVKSRPYRFTAPLGPIETEDLAWYLERYWHWPSGVFQERARGIEQKLPQWGRLLYDAALKTDPAREALEAWKAVTREASRRFTVLVDQDLVAGSPAEQQQDANEAATLLLALPWELIHDDSGYLFQGARGVQVRRRLPNYLRKDPLVTDPPIRVLLISPRPEDDQASYIDHRISARPLVEALAPLGELAQLTLLSPPTFKALAEELQRAYEAGTPYHVVHFDGHGVYDRRHGLGALCFEEPADAAKLEKRRTAIVHAEALAQVIRDHRVPLFFLEACQSVMAEKDPTASVAGKLLQGGVNSVAAMSHTVLVETARRFVTVFYRKLMGGQPIGQAMLAGQRELYGDASRGRVFTGELRLQDWFVPVLFQEELDPQLITAVPAEQVRALTAQERKLSLGDLPVEPGHTFVGRSRELLQAERLLEQQPYVVIRGEGGEGKTTLAAELARWLVLTQRYKRAAFASLETHGDARNVLFAIGQQLVPNYLSQASQDEKRAVQLVERALAEQPTVIVLDNMESVLPPAADSPAAAAFEPEVLEKILALCGRLGPIGRTRLIFTSREALPEPFHQHHITIDRLDQHDAIALVGKVLGEGNLMPHAGDAGQSEEEIEKLVDAVSCHARSLVLLAGEVAASGVRNATENLHALMATLQKKHPDDRERSLLASVELSLRRLPVATRQKIRPLGVFHGGGHFWVIAIVLGLDVEKKEELVTLAQQLIGVGLAELLPYDYLRFNPALCPALLSDLNEQERETARAAWAEAMAQMTAFLYKRYFGNAPGVALHLTLLDLSNLLASLEYLHKTSDAERVVDVATTIESLVARLGRPKALARVTKVRAEATQQLGEWSNARFNAESQAVDRLLDAGRRAAAVAAAKTLLQRAEAAGENAYKGAAYDLASAHFRLGRTLVMGGDAEAALAPLEEARKRFQALADSGNKDAARMASVSLTEAGDCLRALRRLDEAAEAYETTIKLATDRGDRRTVAASKGQLGIVRMYQRRYKEALAAHAEARATFEKFGEPDQVATAWHNIGMVHTWAEQYEDAERAHQAALKIRVQMGDRSGEAATLGELGNLYDAMGRLEDAVRFYRQAVEIYADLKDLAKEGLARTNVAHTLIKLQRYDEARQELSQAIECGKPFGHVAQPWMAFAILCNLERAVGNNAAAQQAREQAIQAYLDYRRSGGENLLGHGWIFADVVQAIAEDQTDVAASQLSELLQEPDLPNDRKALIPALLAVLAGARDPALAADPNLFYQDAAELLLLLESLSRAPKPPLA